MSFKRRHPRKAKINPCEPMQNRYVGDIGDFGKYALLRALTGLYTAPTSARQLRLGVAWFLYPDESHNADGKYTGYLNPTHSNRTKFRACDPQLYDVLQSVVDTGNRNISAIQENHILPRGTVFHENSLFFHRGMSRPARQAAREEWLSEALQATANADLVFVDPDNGVSATADPLRKTGPKYVFSDDLLCFAQRGQSLIIYHHLGRRGTAEQQNQTGLRILASRFGVAGSSGGSSLSPWNSQGLLPCRAGCSQTSN